MKRRVARRRVDAKDLTDIMANDTKTLGKERTKRQVKSFECLRVGHEQWSGRCVWEGRERGSGGGDACAGEISVDWMREE